MKALKHKQKGTVPPKCNVAHEVTQVQLIKKEDVAHMSVIPPINDENTSTMPTFLNAHNCTRATLLLAVVLNNF